MLSLGCQNAEITQLQEELHYRNPDFDKPLQIFEQQKCASERELMGKALRATFEGVAEADDLRTRMSGH